MLLDEVTYFLLNNDLNNVTCGQFAANRRILWGFHFIAETILGRVMVFSCPLTHSTCIQLIKCMCVDMLNIFFDWLLMNITFHHFIKSALIKISFLADKEKGPRTVNDLKLINAGKILENNRTLSECKSPICDFSGMTTMHVVVRAPTLDKQSGKFAVLSKVIQFYHVSFYLIPSCQLLADKRAAKKKDFRCGCAIM